VLAYLLRLSRSRPTSWGKEFDTTFAEMEDEETTKIAKKEKGKVDSDN
jgi:hypothetical protein